MCTTKRRRMLNIYQTVFSIWCLTTMVIMFMRQLALRWARANARTTHDDARRLLYVLATAAGIFEPEFFLYGLQNEMWCIFFVVVRTTWNQIFSVKYARVSSSHRKYQNNVFIRYFAKRFSNVLKTIKKCVCNAQHPGMRWYFAFRMNSIDDRKSTTIEIKSDKNWVQPLAHGQFRREIASILKGEKRNMKFRCFH